LFTAKSDTGVESSLEWLQTSPPTFHTYAELPYVVLSKK
jgi:hypothetical protein